MAAGRRSRFDAEKVVRLVGLNEDGRLEMHFSNARGTRHIVSLPLPVAAELGRLVCDLAEGSPFLTPQAQPKKSKKAVRPL